jgi:hypothetical protein
MARHREPYSVRSDFSTRKRLTIWEQKLHSGASGGVGANRPDWLNIAGRAIWFYLGNSFGRIHHFLAPR